MTASPPAPVRYAARFAASAEEVRAAQRLRHRCFHELRGRALPGGLDRDAHDALCDHILVEDERGGLAACLRVRPFHGDLGGSYAAGSYDLRRLSRFPAPAVEVGRFCIAPEVGGPGAMRAALRMLAQVVRGEGAGLLFGCASLPGADPARHRDALAVLAGCTGPAAWAPAPGAAEVAPLPPPAADRAAARGLPPLLRAYLAMGGWVSGHAVVDRGMDTTHVFIAVETARIPAARARELRLVAPGKAGSGD